MLERELPPADLKRLLKAAAQVKPLVESMTPLLRRGAELGIHEQDALVDLLGSVRSAAAEATDIFWEVYRREQAAKAARNGALVAAPKP